MIRLLAVTVVSLLLCTPTWGADIEVRHAGALYNFMHNGDLSSKFSLSELKGKEHIYALGAAENLKGEIQIFDGVPAVTFAKNGKVSFDKTFNRGAALIVYAQVDKWQDVKIPKDVVSRSQLEIYVKKAAAENGLDIEKPVPFLISGKARFIDWHVIDWDEEDTEHSHRKHIESGPHGRVENPEVIILGFYSNKHKAIFTHHSSDLHMHFKTNDNTLAGHIDDIEVGHDMVLRLPATIK